MEAVQSYDQQEAAAVAAVVTSLGSEVARATDDQDAAAVQEVISALGHSAAESELAEQRHAVHAVLASLGDEACEQFSIVQEAALQSTLQVGFQSVCIKNPMLCHVNAAMHMTHLHNALVSFSPLQSHKQRLS